MNIDMVIDLLRPQLEVTKEDIEPIIYMGLYHHRDLIGSPNAFIKDSTKYENANASYALTVNTFKW